MITTPEEKTPIIENFVDSDNDTIIEDLPFPRNELLPNYVEQNPQAVVDRVYDMILNEHRCVFCQKYLCCGSFIGHDINCWAEDFRGELTYHDLKLILMYQFDAISGSMDDYIDYCFETFDKNKHLKKFFTPPSIGFFVRCFKCIPCEKIDQRTCHCKYHNH